MEEKEVEVKDKLTPIRHAVNVVKYVRQKTDRIILFYSGGKDSIVLLDLLPPFFKEVHCVFMYFVKDLEHQQKLLNYTKKYKNVTLHQYPHWMLSYYYKNGVFCFHNSSKADDDMPIINQSDIEDQARRDTGCDWIFSGEKRSDSLKRYMLLGMFKYDSIVDKKRHVYPLSHWKKKDIHVYTKNKRLIKPVSYNPKAQSEGVDVDLDTLLYLRKNHPRDLEKILEQFPFAGKILFEYDFKNKK